MINLLREILIYNKSTPFQLSTLGQNVRSKIIKISRVSPTGTSFQIWAPTPGSPTAGTFQFAAFECGKIYVIESSDVGYQLSADGSDDGLRNPSDYNHSICSGVTPTPTPTNTLTPTPTRTPTPTPTPTPIVPYVLFYATEPAETETGGWSGGATLPVGGFPNKPDVGGIFLSITCQYAELSYLMRGGVSLDETGIGNIITLKYGQQFFGAAMFENQYYATTLGENDGTSFTYRCGCSLYSGKVTSTSTTLASDPDATVSLTLITDQCPPTPTPTLTPTPTPTSVPGGTQLTAINPNIELGYPCIPVVQCPPDSLGDPDCCGESNKLEYYVSSGLVSYQTVSRNSVLSFANNPTGNVLSEPKIVKLMNGANYYGTITLNTTRYMGASFQITDGCTRYSGVFADGNVLMTPQSIC